MNRAYKLVWNTVSHSWVVASEVAKGRKKSSSTTLKLAMLLAAGLTAGVASAAPAANALPTGESVVAGSASFDRTVANQLTVNQSGSKLITNWNSFDVGSGATVTFAQPDAASIALNRVTSGSASEIFGQVTANGQLVLVNPNGITFGAGSQVSAASIIGSVLDISDTDFNNGTLLFSRGAVTGTIDNQGSLNATAGSVSLLAPTVKNSGSISATGGNAALMNADAVDVTAIDPVISTASTISGLIQQSGSITATQVSSVGGKILLTGDSSQSTSQIQLAGTLDATTNTNVNGRSILINGDVSLNGATNSLDLTSTDGYSLSNAAQLNLNGASSGFSVNGTAYTVVRDVNQLQAMSSNLSGRYVLAGNIDASATAGWNAGAGFVPVGNSSTPFSGVLDGLGHRIDQLTVLRPTTGNSGLFGQASGMLIQNLGLNNVNISGGLSSGVLVGRLVNNNTADSIVKNVYSTGTYTASGSNFQGGLIGAISSFGGSTAFRLSNIYSTVNVVASSGQHIGGIIGGLSSPSVSASPILTITDAYFAGTVSGGSASNVGGIIGGAAANMNVLVERAYSSGLIRGTSINTTGALIGGSLASVTFSNSYWNTETTGQALAVGNSTGTQTNVVGLTTAQSTQLSSYANWGSNIDAQGGTGAIWRIYDGQSGPLLRSFLKPLSISVHNNVSKTYDGTNYAGGTANYTVNAAYDNSKLLGTATQAGSALNARNAGTYDIDIGLYSGQDGYDLVVDTGTLTINKRLLTITATNASKEYDGKLTSSDKPTVVGRQRGDSIVGLTQSYLDKNAGTGKTINVDAGYTIRDGNNGNNYDVVLVNSNAGVITPKALTISTVANSKVYDGGVTSANKPVVTGLVTGDRITGLFQQYESKTVGTGKKLLIKAGYVVNDGNGGSNYSVTEQGSTDGVITAN